MTANLPVNRERPGRHRRRLRLQHRHHHRDDAERFQELAGADRFLDALLGIRIPDGRGTKNLFAVGQDISVAEVRANLEPVPADKYRLVNLTRP
ncbi:hypothetical protein OG456_01795 [Streptomyces sp. NBC_01446]|uniref:Uncharacterized protein n=1 Tax=Streptomyces sp. NBC_00119 TaxID=2975659 RepID=A0AAU1U3H5_9ACTN|nr:hypothetical protein [Streptomyces sp. NBC_01446]